MTAHPPSPALFFDTINAYQKTESLRTAIELDLFTKIGEGRRTATEIAEGCLASPRGIRILADSLTINGFLTKHEDRYELTPDSDAFLNRHSPAFVGGTLEFLLTPEIRW